MKAITRALSGAGVVLIVAMAASIPSPGTEEPTATAQPVASASATAAVSATPHPLQMVEGVRGVGSVGEQWGVYYAEIRTGRLDQGMAEALMAASPAGLDEYQFILDDGTRAVSWLWRRQRGEWTETHLSVTAAGTATIEVSGPRPGNCATAVALGLTAAEAGRWAHLDRDKDGVACYGD